MSSRFVIAIPTAALMLVAANAAAELPDKRSSAPDPVPSAVLVPARATPPGQRPAARPEPPARQQVAATRAAPRSTPVGRPETANRLVHETGGDRLCIGGVLCETFCAGKQVTCKPVRTLTIKLDKPARIDTIQLSAHDDIGPSRRSRLLIKVNGRQVGSTLVYRLGSTLSFDVDAAGELITIESEHQYNGFLRGGEEAVVWDVFVFGEERS